MKRRTPGIGIVFLSLFLAACGISPTLHTVPPTFTPLPNETPALSFTKVG